MNKVDLTSHPDPKPLIVTIGYASDGLAALRDFFGSFSQKNIPNMTFILIQHQAAQPEYLLHEILAKELVQANLDIFQAYEGCQWSAFNVIIVPPGHHARVEAGALRLKKASPDSKKTFHPIDEFFSSLAQGQEMRTAGILLSGTGHDGPLGLSTIRDHGGLTLIQEETSSELIDQSPMEKRNQIVDLVLPPHKMFDELVKFARRLETSEESNPTAVPRDILDRLFLLLKDKTGIDFSNYRRGTILRRTTKRLLTSSLQDLNSYLDHLEKSPEEVEALYRDLLINVTGFFRDELNFRALSSTVFSKLIQQSTLDAPIRIWVPGCSTGEEAYSLAIALKEFGKMASRSVSFTIFATDVDDHALKQARDGFYSECSVASLPENIIKDYFEFIEGHYRVKKEIRTLCVFARQDVIHDPPFSNLDLISCRNLFIYFNQTLQKRVLEIFHYALKPGRFLFLGASESIPTDSELFSGLAKEHRIFQRSQRTRRRLQISGMTPIWERSQQWRQPFHYRNEPPKPRDLKAEIQEILWSRLPWARIVVNEQMTVLFTEGPIEQFVQLPSGVTNLNLLKMAKSGLGLELRTAIHKSNEQQGPIFRSGIIVSIQQQEPASVDLEVMPLRSEDSEERLFLVLIRKSSIEQIPAVGSKLPDSSSIQSTEFKRVEQELIATREFLQSVIEQQDAVAEELKSANEEIFARNEELQSSNEELETTKEELQAGNEELTTLNDELVARNNELNQLNTAVKESEQKFRSLTQSANDAIITCDSDGDVVLWNQGAQTVFGYSEKEMIGKNISRVMPTRYRLAHMAGMKRVLKGGKPNAIGKTVELEGIRKDGSEFPIELSLSKWHLEKGTYFTGIIRDVSDQVWMRRLQIARVEISKVLLSTQTVDEVISQGLRIICEQMSYKIGAFWKFDVKVDRLRWHLMWPAPPGAYKKLYDINANLTFSRGEGIPGHVWDNNPVWIQDLHSDPRFIRRDAFRAFDVQTSIAFPIGSGEEFFGLVEIFSTSSLKPEPGVLALLDDIGSYLNQFIQRKLAEENSQLVMNKLEMRVEERTKALAESENRHRLLAEVSSLLASCVNYEATLQNLADLCISTIADWCLVEVVGERDTSMRSIAHADPMKVELVRQLIDKYPNNPNSKVGPAHVFRTGKSEIMPEISEDLIINLALSAEHLAILKSLSFRSYICVPMTIRDTIIGTMTLVFSESERAYRNEDVPLAEEIARRAALAADRVRLLTEAQSANKAKDEFLATLSHELRTPMNIILGWVEILRNERDEETLSSALEMLERNSRIQIKLINDLLDISRITSRKLPVEMVPLEITAIIQSAIRDMSSHAEAKNIDLKLISSEAFKAPILGDAVRLHQVFQNLINNAIKFTPTNGTIKVRVSKDNDNIFVKIEDTGIGIHPEFIDHVFESFRQEDGSSTRQHGGLGLGLAIAKYLVGQHKGRIEVQSEGRDQGAAFTVILPLCSDVANPTMLPLVGEQPAWGKNDPVLDKINILVVDDAPDILYLLERILSRRGAKIQLALSAEEAFKKLTACRFDIILCDVGMPKQDGLSFIKELRGWPPGVGGNTPAIAFTAYARQEEVEAALNAGFETHLAKPATEALLIETILKVIKNSH